MFEITIDEDGVLRYVQSTAEDISLSDFAL
jgi:hypothetical protein